MPFSIIIANNINYIFLLLYKVVYKSYDSWPRPSTLSFLVDIQWNTSKNKSFSISYKQLIFNDTHAVGNFLTSICFISLKIQTFLRMMFFSIPSNLRVVKLNMVLISTLIHWQTMLISNLVFSNKMLQLEANLMMENLKNHLWYSLNANLRSTKIQNSLYFMVVIMLLIWKYSFSILFIFFFISIYFFMLNLNIKTSRRLI